jgi:hypothetical protein
MCNVPNTAFPKTNKHTNYNYVRDTCEKYPISLSTKNRMSGITVAQNMGGELQTLVEAVQILLVSANNDLRAISRTISATKIFLYDVAAHLLNS